MKQLSIEEKAKRYDEVVAMAKECITYIPDEAVNKYMLAMFPELAELEDERIRKAILEHIQLCSESIPDKDKWIAWLEKQSEQKPQGKSALETINEEEVDNANKVEPKFNLYDWVVTDKGDIVQIGAVNNGYYTMSNGMDFNMSYVDKCWHRWTIEDAKEGDVLCTYECGEPKIVFILKGIPKKHRALSYHCYYNLMCPYFKTDSEIGCLAPNEEEVKPATKEQCDTLFARMKEAGYKME